MTSKSKIKYREGDQRGIGLAQMLSDYICVCLQNYSKTGFKPFIEVESDVLTIASIVEKHLINKEPITGDLASNQDLIKLNNELRDDMRVLGKFYLTIASKTKIFKNIKEMRLHVVLLRNIHAGDDLMIVESPYKKNASLGFMVSRSIYEASLDLGGPEKDKAIRYH